MTRAHVGAVEEFDPGDRALVTLHGREVAVVNYEGEWYAILNRCLHDGGPLCEGDVHESLVADVRGVTDREVHVDVNTADDYDEGSIYLTTTGTSAEHGDDGSVGRGNRANGLITPNRPMSMEATSGKNPVNHIGKIYNLLSTEVAKSVVADVDGIRQLQLRLLSQIGRPIDEPHVADASVITEDGVSVADVESEVEAAIDRELADVTGLTQRVIDGELSTF